jgi:hypothetical protein
MSDVPHEPSDDICARLGVWPVRFTAAGATGWSLWFGGEIDVLLGRRGVVPLFPSPEALAAALAAEPDAFSPPVAARLSPSALALVLASSTAECDLDAASAWFARPDREADTSSCEQALNAINMAADIGATAGDADIAALFRSDALTPAHDALTFGQTLLGDSSPFRGDPAAMAAAITPEAAAAAVRLLALAAPHVKAA